MTIERQKEIVLTVMKQVNETRPMKVHPRRDVARIVQALVDDGVVSVEVKDGVWYARVK